VQAALSIEGIINIEQAKSDRNQIIFSVGSGFWLLMRSRASKNP